MKKMGDVKGTAKATQSISGMHHEGAATRPESGAGKAVGVPGPCVKRSGLSGAVRHLEKMGKNTGIHLLKKE